MFHLVVTRAAAASSCCCHADNHFSFELSLCLIIVGLLNLLFTTPNFYYDCSMFSHFVAFFLIRFERLFVLFFYFCVKIIMDAVEIYRISLIVNVANKISACLLFPRMTQQQAKKEVHTVHGKRWMQR